jgi:hypothetical protein
MNSAPADRAITGMCRKFLASNPRDSRATRIRRISSMITSMYLSMNMAICTSRLGSRSR